MVNARLANVSLMVSITLWGTLLGGIAYAHIVYFPVYLGHLPESAVVVNGPYGLNEATFWALIHPLLILSLITSLIVNWKLQPRRKLIATTLGVYVVALVISFLYFIPDLREFQRSPQSGLSAAAWLARGQMWQHLSWLRGA